MVQAEQRSIAVIGGGLIGLSWTALFMAHGRNVALFEPDEQARLRVRDQLENPLAQLAEIFPNLPPQGRLLLPGTLEDAAEKAGWIQENIPEKIPLKRQIYAALEASAPPDVTIASSTSSLIWSELSAEMENPDRLITAHPFNPPHLMPLVELFGPDRDRIADAVEFYRSFGRHPVTLKREAVGHIANRLSSALWREAVNIVAEDIADVAAVDEALVYGPGLRWSVMGAHMSYHLGGGQGGIAHYLDHLGPSQERRWQDLGSPSLDGETCAALVAGIAQEAGGRDITTLEKARDTALIAIQRVLNEKRP